MYQYFIKTEDNDKLYGRLYRINIYNNEKLEHLYIKNSTRIRILKEMNFLKYIVTK
jgi:transcription elongation factor